MSKNKVICAECARELAPPHQAERRIPIDHADQIVISQMLQVIGQFTYTPMQAEHLMVRLRGQVRR